MRLAVALFAAWLVAPATSTAATEPAYRGSVAAGGRPLAGAEVELLPAPGRIALGVELLVGEEPEPLGRTRTGVDGRFELRPPALAPGRIRVRARGWATMEIAVVPVPLALTDADGRATLFVEPGSSLEVEVRGPDAAFARARLPPPPVEPADAVVEVVLAPATEIHGRAFDRATERPLAGVFVTAAAAVAPATSDADGAPIEGASVFARLSEPELFAFGITDAQGGFRIGPLGPGRWTLQLPLDFKTTVDLAVVDLEEDVPLHDLVLVRPSAPEDEAAGSPLE